MNRRLAITYPLGDLEFARSVREALQQASAWDLESPEGIALLQALLRVTYPTATVVAPEEAEAEPLTHSARVAAVYRYGGQGQHAERARWFGAAVDGAVARAYSMALAVLGTSRDAAEVVEESFGAAWATEGPPEDEEGWRVTLVAGVRDRAIARRRSRPPEAGGAPEHPQDRGLGGRLALPDATTTTARVRTAVTSLPSHQRRALDMAYFEGLTGTEIAGRLGVGVPAVSVLLRDALLAVGRAVPSPAPEGGADVQGGSAGSEAATA